MPWGNPRERYEKEMAGEEVVDTPFGKFMIHPQDLIGSTTKAGTLWDGAGFLIPLALEHGGFGANCSCGVPACPAFTPNTILDIGANIGTFSIWLARQGAWRVIAVEPVPDTLRILKANLDANREVCDARVIPIGVAAYDRQARLTYKHTDFTREGNIGGLALEPVESNCLYPEERYIPAAPLDSYQHCFGKRVSLIKCDAQGCDLRALRGLRETIARDAPFIIFEWEVDLAAVHGDTWADVLAYLDEIGYTVRAWPTHPGNFVAWRV